MKVKLTLLTLALVILSGCQSVPAQRKNNCACNWEPLSGLAQGAVA